MNSHNGLAQTHEVKPIRVLFVDDYPRLVDALKRMINAECDMTCCGTAQSTDEFLSAVPQLAPDVAIVDLTMPGSVEPLAAISKAVADRPTMRVIVYSGHDDDDTRTRAISAGAHGLVSKIAMPQTLIDSIRAVSKGTKV